jgi:hypothetical protein
MTWPLPPERGSCGNAIVPDGPAFVRPSVVSSSAAEDGGKKGNPLKALGCHAINPLRAVTHVAPSRVEQFFK